jgi:predicted alpha/beta hydrolase family esterase
MKNAIIIHGTCDEEEYFSDRYPSLSNSHWLPWLQKQLLIKGIFTQTPEMPEAYKPDYNKWRKEFERFNIDENTILIGHSCGGFLMRWLTENKIKVNKLILVAPWLDPDRRKTTNFFNFSIDPQIQERIRAIHIFVSDNDESDILQSVKIVEETLPQAKLHKFHNMGHFTENDMGRKEFPELLDTVLTRQ